MSREAWLKYLKGDETSFSELYHAYFQKLLAYALKIGFDKETGKDAIQDVFFKIYTSKNKLSHIQNIEFYLLQALKNRLFDIHNKKNKIKKINYNDTPFDYDDILIENEDIIIEKMISEEREVQLKSTISQLLQTLPPKQRRIINYHYQFSLSYVEIGKLLNLSPETVKKSMYKSIKKLKQVIPLSLSGKYPFI